MARRFYFYLFCGYCYKLLSVGPVVVLVFFGVGNVVADIFVFRGQRLDKFVVPLGFDDDDRKRFVFEINNQFVRFGK